MHNLNVWYRCRSVALLPLKISISLAWALITFIRRLWSALVILLCRSTNQSFHHFHLLSLMSVCKLFKELLKPPQSKTRPPPTKKRFFCNSLLSFSFAKFSFYFFSLYQFLAGWQIGSFPVIRWRWLCNLSWKCTKGPTSFKKEDQLLSPAFSPDGVLLGSTMKNLNCQLGWA